MRTINDTVYRCVYYFSARALTGLNHYHPCMQPPSSPYHLDSVLKAFVVDRLQRIRVIRFDASRRPVCYTLFPRSSIVAISRRRPTEGTLCPHTYNSRINIYILCIQLYTLQYYYNAYTAVNVYTPGAR